MEFPIHTESAYDMEQRLRREQWRHEARLEFAKVLLTADLEGNGKPDANGLIEVANQLAFLMYPEDK
jgi:hypothetical protein